MALLVILAEQFRQELLTVPDDWICHTFKRKLLKAFLQMMLPFAFQFTFTENGVAYAATPDLFS